MCAASASCCNVIFSPALEEMICTSWSAMRCSAWLVDGSCAAGWKERFFSQRIRSARSSFKRLSTQSYAKFVLLCSSSIRRSSVIWRAVSARTWPQREEQGESTAARKETVRKLTGRSAYCMCQMFRLMSSICCDRSRISTPPTRLCSSPRST